MIGQYKKMTDNYNYFYFYNNNLYNNNLYNNLYIKNNLYFKKYFKNVFWNTRKKREKVCPNAPRVERTKSSKQNNKTKPRILFPDFESSDLDLSTPNNGITYNEERLNKKRKTISYSLELLNSLKKFI